MTNSLRLALTCLLSCAALNAAANPVAVHLLDQAGKPVPDAVVYAEAASGAMPAALKSAEIEQRGLKFLPLVTVIQTGSRIAFPNNDKVKHHIYSFSPAKRFDQKLYSGAAAATQVFDKAGTVVLGCNIHDRMLAYVKVVDTPFFGKSSADGVVHLDLPAGARFNVKVWHYNSRGDAPDQSVTLKAGDAAQPLTFKLSLKPPVVEAAADDPGY